jgi:Family of unknown function (DUF6152)
MRYMAILASGIVVVLMGTGLYAHHSHPDFVDDRVQTIDGRIETLKYENPHSHMTVVTSDGILYAIEFKAATQLRMGGQCYANIYTDTLNIGDHLVVSGFPPRDPRRYELVNLKQMIRPADGWRWWLDDPRCHH